MKEVQAAFDSVARALAFAFNADGAYIAPPVMNRVMAAIPAKKKRGQKEVGWTRKPSGPPPQPGEAVRGLDKAAQAGLILQLVGRLGQEQQNALQARFTRPQVPCSCGSPCCQGSRTHSGWKRAIDGLCETLKSDANVMRRRGKLGMSTEPRLRLAIVVNYFRDTPDSMAGIAASVGVNSVTAARHSELIRSYLYRVESDALLEIALIFDQVGVVGYLD